MLTAECANDKHGNCQGWSDEPDDAPELFPFFFECACQCHFVPWFPRDVVDTKPL